MATIQRRPARPHGPLAVALAAALLAPAADAGNAEQTFSGGILGEVVTYTVTGTPGELYAHLPSFSPGPTPLGVFFPGNPLVMNVGTELLSFSQAGPFAGAPVNLVYPLPNIPALAGFPLLAQFAQISLVPLDATQVSNRVDFALAYHDTTHNTLGANLTARQGHSVTALDDGTVLVVGGDEPDGLGNLTAIDTIELYDPNTQSFTLLPGTLTTERSTHTATKLNDGRVLICGGYDVTETVQASCEIWDPNTQTSSAAASMGDARTQHTATLLADGRVLAVGGAAMFDLTDLTTVLASLNNSHKSAEVYDPVANTWTSVPDLPIGGLLPIGIVGHNASLLSTGDVLVTAGIRVNNLLLSPIPSFRDECFLFSPGSSSWSSAPDMPIPVRGYHGQAALPDGKAIVVGGANGDFLALPTPLFTPLSECARYDPVTNAWTAVASLNNARAYPNLVILADEAVVIGGLEDVDVSTGSGTPVQEIEVATPALLSWTDAASLALPREVARAAAVQGGERIVIVGTGDNGIPAVDTTAEVYVR